MLYLQTLIKAFANINPNKPMPLPAYGVSVVRTSLAATPPWPYVLPVTPREGEPRCGHQTTTQMQIPAPLHKTIEP